MREAKTVKESRAARRRAAKAAVKDTSASLDAQKLIQRAEDAMAPQLTSFVLLFWANGDPTTNTATIHLKNLRTRETLNLLLPAFEHAVSLDRQKKGASAPPEYHEIMARFVQDVKDAYARANTSLTQLDQERAKQKN